MIVVGQIISVVQTAMVMQMVIYKIIAALIG